MLSASEPWLNPLTSVPPPALRWDSVPDPCYVQFSIFLWPVWNSDVVQITLVFIYHIPQTISASHIAANPMFNLF